MGRVHEKPVGPHPDWSCQLAFKPALFGEVIPWLAMNHKGLVVFTPSATTTWWTTVIVPCGWVPCARWT